jgi:oligoendopeptidase F
MLDRTSPRVPFAVLTLSLLPRTGPCQEAFEAIPREAALHYHIDFARHFFASPEAEKADRAKLVASLEALESLAGEVIRSADNLETALHLHDSVLIEFNRHYAYLYLRHAVDTADAASLADSADLDTEVSARTAFLRDELMRLDDAAFAAFVAQKPSLEVYRFTIQAARRHEPYSLPLEEEELLAATVSMNTGWQADLYAKLRERDSKPTGNSGLKRDGGGELQRDLYAFTLLRLASARDRLARLHHFPDAPSAAYFDSYWSRAEVDDLLEEVARHTDLYKRYQQIRTDHVRATTGGAEPGNALGARSPRYTIDEARRILPAALAPLGAEYGEELAALLEPSNGRMDIVPGDHRKRGGFSKGFIGTESVFYSGGFAGAYNDLRVLAHESTHAVHRQLMNRGRVLPAYAEGPHYLFESFAIFSEFLLPDYLARQATDPLLEQFYLEQFLDGKGFGMFAVAPEVILEHAIYDGVGDGSIEGADDLDALSEQVYSEWPVIHDELASQWMRISLMYEDPFYDLNYVYGDLLALEFCALYTRDPQQFTPRYIALMRNGFDAPPEALLKRFLGVDLHDPALLSNAFGVLEDKVSLLEKSYRR